MKENSGQQTLESMSQADWYNKWTLAKFKSFLRGDILEIGCGIGNFTKTLKDFGQVFAVDINQNYINQTARLLNSKSKVGYGDIEKGKYFFKDKEFDTVVCINVLEHIENDIRALSNISKVLKKGGFLVLIIPSHPLLFGEIDKSINHFRRYTKNEILNKLQKSGLQVVQFKRLNFLGAIGWFISGRILKNKIVESSKIKIFNIFAPMVLRIEGLIQPPFGTSFLIIAEKK